MNRYDSIILKNINRPGLVISRGLQVFLWEYKNENFIAVTMDNPDIGRRFVVTKLDLLEIRDQLTNEITWMPDPQVVQ